MVCPFVELRLCVGPYSVLGGSSPPCAPNKCAFQTFFVGSLTLLPRYDLSQGVPSTLASRAEGLLFYSSTFHHVAFCSTGGH